MPLLIGFCCSLSLSLFRWYIPLSLIEPSPMVKSNRYSAIASEIEGLFGIQVYSLKGKAAKGQSRASPKHVLSKTQNVSVVDEYGRVSHQSPATTNKARSPNERIIGVLPRPQLFDSSHTSDRCSSPDTQSEKSFDEGRSSQDDDATPDNVIIVSQTSSTPLGVPSHLVAEGSESFSLSRMMGRLSPYRSSNSNHTKPPVATKIARKKISSADMAFLATDPYALTRGPPREQRGSPSKPPRHRPPPLALSNSNGRTTSGSPSTNAAKSHYQTRQHVLAAPTMEEAAAELAMARATRVSTTTTPCPYTPFTRPRAAPAPPAAPSCLLPALPITTTTTTAASAARAHHHHHHSRHETNPTVPNEVSPSSEPNDEIIIITSPHDSHDNPHAKGRSFFIEDDDDESPTDATTFGSTLAKKITLRGGQWRKAVAHRI